MKIVGFHLEESKRNKGAMLLIATDEEGDRWVIGGNVLRLCVCLPLHNPSILPQMLMGQIAQNRCYKLAAVN